MSSKLVNHHQSTQSSASGHKCFDYNYKGNCLKSNCQYTHSCIRCAGMHPVISCNQTRLQSYTHNGQRTSQSSFRTKPISSSIPYTTANHSFGLQSQQQQWRPQQWQPSRFTYRATQKHLGPRKIPINKLVLNNYLVNYPNKTKANKLLSGFSFGFRLQYFGPILHIESSNLITAHQHPRETMEKIANEIKLGRIGGP